MASDFDSVYSLAGSSEEEDDDDFSTSYPSDNFDLYGEFDKLETNETICESLTNILALSGPRVFALNPYEIAKIVPHDSNIEKEFLANTNSLHALLHVCDKIVAIVHIANIRSLGFFEAAAKASTSSSGLEVVTLRNSKKPDDVPNQFEITTEEGKQMCKCMVNTNFHFNNFYPFNSRTAISLQTSSICCFPFCYTH